MTRYNVHIYREMRLFFPGIEAGSVDEAVGLAAGKSSHDAELIDDCEGETLAALVDVVGNKTFEQSRMIDFEAELLRKAGPALLAVVTSVRTALEYHDHWAKTMPGHLLGVINDALTELTARRAV